MITRIFYAASGPGDLVETHRRWLRGEHNPTEVSITFSSHIEEFCRDIGVQAYLISTHPRREIVKDGKFTLEHLPKASRRGVLFHITQLHYGFRLLARALRFRADVALIDSGCTHFFVLTIFKAFAIPVVPILHNTLWPAGFPPTKVVARLILFLDSLFWRWIPAAALAVSPECERQVEALRKKRSYCIHQIRAQFLPEYFARIAPPPPHDQRPFRMMFVGRIERSKGVFDLLDIARKIEDHRAGLVRWEICGQGSDLAVLRERHAQLRLKDVVLIRGWTSLEDLLEVYGRSHACIVPTRSTFTEGLAMTAAEAILAGRPLVTNPVVPALELLRPACYPAKTNDPDSHMEGVLRLATDAELYRQLRSACEDLRSPFYDRRYSLGAVLNQALSKLA